MKFYLKLILGVSLVLLPFTCNGQTKNPRGIYKLITLVGKNGKIPSPFDQYKICTDSATITVYGERNNTFTFSIVDSVINYTGETPQSKKTQIYDSNDKHFSIKWWSEYANHWYFPHNDWCIENYEAEKYSDVAKPIFEAITKQVKEDKDNSLIGTWYCVGERDELEKAEKFAKVVKKQNVTDVINWGTGKFILFTPNHIVNVWPARRNTMSASLKNVEYDGASKFYVKGDRFTEINWYSKDCMIREVYGTTTTTYEVWVKVTTEEPLISTISSILIN